MSRIHQQHGAVLAISLILLFALVVLGIAGSQVTSLEEKMAGNLRQRNLAFQAAESALLDAELFLQGNDSTLNLRLGDGPFMRVADGEVPVCSNGFCQRPVSAQPDPPSGWRSNGRCYRAAINDRCTNAASNDSDGIPLVGQQPRYVLELLSTDPSIPDGGPCFATFRITAIGWGSDTNAEVRLQSIYVLRATSCL
jgi:type IV pilus assembly protein PilX